MKAYKLELLVLDFEGYGAEEIRIIAENARGLDPTVMAIEEREIGEWSDAHPLNHKATASAEYARLFASPVQGAASDDRQAMTQAEMQALCAANPVAASGLPLGAASSASGDDSRARFEAWYAPIFKAGEPANMPRRENGEYRSAQDQIAWMAWQASSGAAVAKADQASGTDQAHVMPPMRGTDGQHDAGASALSEKRIGELWLTVCRIEHATNRQIAFARAIELELASRFRGHGGNTDAVAWCVKNPNGDDPPVLIYGNGAVLKPGDQLYLGAPTAEGEARDADLWRALVRDTEAQPCEYPCLRDDLADWIAAHPAPKGGDK